MSNAFVETKNMFRTATGYTAPLTFDQWNALPNDYKAAVLFVQFFDQITLAWYKVKSFYTEDEDGVSTILQYLQKNVPVIEEDSKRFTPTYIYRVAFNCLYCICHDIQRDKERWEKEMSNVIYSASGDELDLFDTVAQDSIEHDAASIDIWKLVDSVLKVKVDDKMTVDGRVEAVLNKLMGGTAACKVFKADPKSKVWKFGPDTESNASTYETVYSEFKNQVVKKLHRALALAGYGEVNYSDLAILVAEALNPVMAAHNVSTLEQLQKVETEVENKDGTKDKCRKWTDDDIKYVISQALESNLGKKNAYVYDDDDGCVVVCHYDMMPYSQFIRLVSKELKLMQE